MKGKRPIDRLRDAAGSMRIADGGQITSMIVIGGVLHSISEESIHEIKLADNIDPKRTNPEIPNAQRKVLSLGSQSPIVGKTLLTAHTLFDAKFLRQGLDVDKALSGTFQALHEIAGMNDLALELDAAQKHATKGGSVEVEPNRSVSIPQVGHPERRCKEFVQKGDHALQELFRIPTLFFPTLSAKRWFEALRDEAVRTLGKDHNFSQFLAEALPLYKFVRDVRNAIEHKDEKKRVDVSDYELDASGVVKPPMMGILLEGQPLQQIPLADFFRWMLDAVVEHFETQIAFLAEISISSETGFKHLLIEMPLEMRRYPNVRYSFGVELDGRVMPIS